ncbi:MAG: UDP-N-acetylmuramate--L-alanine ligase [Candidatus Rariloculaceae bacterium]
MKERMGRIQCIHLVGIGGVGMSGIAEVLINLGYDVQGSDISVNETTKRLVSLGVKFFSSHDADNMQNADVVVVSSAISKSNPEIVEADRRRIPVVQRAEMLAELMRFRYGIAVAGTHGKTTTTSLVASVLAEAGMDPTFVVGGRLVSADANARLGSGRYLVAEADESDASFLHLQPMIAVVTNIDADHLTSYEGELRRLKEGFNDFLHNLPFYGLAVMCADDENTCEITAKLSRRVVTYGFSEGADVQARNARAVGLGTSFEVHRRDHKPFELTLNLPGRHNVLNALAAVAVAAELNIDDRAILAAFEEFSGIDRRFQVLGRVTTPNGMVTFVDDYGHHPTEIAATVAAVRETWPEHRLVVAFQPHRYTRTHELFDDFTQVLSKVDVLLLTEIYAAGEAPIAGAEGRSLARAVRARGLVEPIFVENLEALATALAEVVRDGDVVLTLGAGSIGTIVQTLPKRLATSIPIEVKG